MKNKYTTLILSLSILSLVSCSNVISETSKQTENNITRKDLVIKTSPKTDYEQYETLDFSSLIVEEAHYDINNTLIESVEIDDYSLRNQQTGEEITDGQKLTESGSLYVEIYKEGCTSRVFTLYIAEVTNISETITITEYPKTGYIINEPFSSDGLVVTLTTRYRLDGITQRKSEVLTDYEILIDDTSSDNYTFTKGGIYTININYTSKMTDKVLNTFYSVTVIKEDNVTTPKEYNDSSISFVEDSKQMQVTISNPNKESVSSDKGYYSPDEVINSYNVNNYRERNIYNEILTPATGKTPLLIVPIVTPGDESKATEENWDLINKAFFGNSSDLHFESLHSYYYKSSYGKLDFTGGVTGYFNPATEDNSFKTLNGYTTTNIEKLPQLAADWAEKTYNLDLKNYDSNNDGYIDAIWLIYLHESSSSNTNFWAYCSTNMAHYTDINYPVANIYGWASINFLNDNYVSNSSYNNYANKDCDAHVLIHETGHLLGASDYYSYSGTYYDALGCMDMMDRNLGDHNAYTKMYFGWVTPYIAYSNCTITIPSSQKENALILIPYDDYTIKKDSNGKVILNTFDEYIIVEYYTYQGLNTQGYDCYSVNPISGNGAKIYHVDNRLFKYSDYSFSLYSNPNEPFEDNNNDQFERCISNSEAGSTSESNRYYLSSTMNNYDEIRLINKQGSKLSLSNTANANSLFTVNNTFSLSSYSSQFNNGFNNGKSFSYSLTVDSLS